MYTTRKDFLKQTGFALAGSFLPYSRIFGNLFNPIPTVINSPSDCSWDLREGGYIFGTDQIIHGLTSPIYTYNKPNKLVPTNLDNDPLKDVVYLEEQQLSCIDKTKILVNDCSYLNRHKTDETQLKYKVSYPKPFSSQNLGGHDYLNLPLPVFVFFHAGGLKECSDYDDDFSEQMALEFCRKGFIVYRVEYRTGRWLDDDGTRTSAQEHLATYRGIQDARGSLKTILFRNANNMGSSYDGTFIFNPTQFFIGGASAGAGIALNTAFLRDQAMVDETYKVKSSSLSISGALGGIDADYYAAPSGSPLPVISGVLSCWGALRMPVADDQAAFFVDPNPGSTPSTSPFNPPVIGFHGLLDDVNPYPDDRPQDFKNSTAPDWKLEDFCLYNNNTGNYFIKPPKMPLTVAQFTKKGSSLTNYKILMDSRINRYAELYMDCLAKHGLDKDDNSLATDYGTGYKIDAEVVTYIAGRAAVFFQVIMNYTGSNPHPLFTYLEPTRRSYFAKCKNRRKCVDNINKTSCTTDFPSEICPTNI